MIVFYSSKQTDSKNINTRSDLGGLKIKSIMKKKSLNLSRLVVAMLLLTNLSSCTEESDIQSVEKNRQLLIVKDMSPTLDVTTSGKSTKSAKAAYENSEMIYRFHIFRRIN